MVFSLFSAPQQTPLEKFLAQFNKCNNLFDVISEKYGLEDLSMPGLRRGLTPSHRLLLKIEGILDKIGPSLLTGRIKTIQTECAKLSKIVKTHASDRNDIQSVLNQLKELCTLAPQLTSPSSNKPQPQPQQPSVSCRS